MNKVTLGDCIRTFGWLLDRHYIRSSKNPNCYVSVQHLIIHGMHIRDDASLFYNESDDITGVSWDEQWSEADKEAAIKRLKNYSGV